MPEWIIVGIKGVVGTIIIGIITNICWELLRNFLSFKSSKYVDLRGTWKINSTLERVGHDPIHIQEKMVIKQQFGGRFRGIIYTPNTSDPTKTIELIVRGEFKDKFRCIYWYENSSSNQTEVGTGMFQITTGHMFAEGISVNYGIDSPDKPATIRFTMNKLQ